TGGDSSSAYTGAGIKVSIAAPLTPPAEARTVSRLGFVTRAVASGKEPLLAPAGMVMLPGTEASAGLSQARLTIAPPAPAGALSDAVTVNDWPPTRLAIPGRRVTAGAETSGVWSK